MRVAIVACATLLCTAVHAAVLEGTAHTVMEDHQRVKQHFVHTYVRPSGSDDLVEVFGMEPGERYRGEAVRWEVRDASDADVDEFKRGRGHNHGSRPGDDSSDSGRSENPAMLNRRRSVRTGKLAPRPRQLEEVEQQQEQEQGGEQHLRGAARQLAWSAPVTNGANSLLVVRVVQKFPTVAGQADRSPGFCDETCVRNAIWGGAQNLAGAFLDSSGGFTFSREGAAVRPSRVVTVSVTATALDLTECDWQRWGEDALKALTFDHTVYTFKLFLMPQEACWDGGVAWMGCTASYCKAYVFDQYPDEVWMHEIGHNLGMEHAGGDDNNDGIMEDEYADASCPMGVGWPYRRFNAPHRLQKGWLGSGNIVADPAEGDVAIVSNSVVQTGSTSKAMIQFTRAESVYVSLRTNALSRPASYDSTLVADDANKVFVHRYATGSYTKRTARLAVGESFTDSVNGFGIVFKSLDTATDTAVVTVVRPPAVTTHPTPQSVTEGQSFTFRAAAAATVGAVSYQWQRNSVDIAGATASTYSAAAAAGDNGAVFSCVISSVGGRVASAGAALTVTSSTLPVITGEPADATVAVRGTASFTVASSGASTFEWLRNGATVAGATTATLSFTVTDADAAASPLSFQVRVSNPVGAVLSRVATLQVQLSAPAIATPPASSTIAAGASALLTVAATGGALQYQWYVTGGAAVVDATLPSLSVTPAATTSYTVVVSNAVGPAASAAATVTVIGLPVITQNPASRSVTAGTAAAFSVTATGVGVTYQWLRNGANLAGQTTSALSLATTAADVAVSPISVQCRVSTIAGGVLSAAATLTVTVPPPTISTQPVSQSAPVRTSRTFSVVAAGSSLSYQWRRNGVNIAGATAASYTIVASNADFTASAAGIYFTCVVSNPGGSVTSSQARLTVTASLPVVSVAASPSATVASGTAVTFQATATGGGLTYQWQTASATSTTFTSISGATASTYRVTAASTINKRKYRVVVRNTVGTVTSATVVLTVV